MEEKLVAKIDSIIEFILQKPESKITHDDYSILFSELRNIRNFEAEKERNAKFYESLALLMGCSTTSK